MRRLLELRGNHRQHRTKNLIASLENGIAEDVEAKGHKTSFTHSDRLWSKLEAAKHSVGSNGAPKSTVAAHRWLRNVRSVLEDWLFLAMLGILMACCSLVMDVAIEGLQRFHVRSIDAVQAHVQRVHWHGALRMLCTFGVWTGFAVALVTASAWSVRAVAPQAIGSGIPEMKTILRGVILKEYLTLRTLIAKMVGLALALGSGMPIGKEGPFVHIASVVANLLSHCVRSLRSPFGNESRSYEMLAAACAVGVSSTFSAPVGGVLFSIEVTSAYFAIRNYWRGFFAATCSATLLRLLHVLTIDTEVTVNAFYQTKFPRDAFFPEELPFFALIGIFCGFLAAAFIALQRQLVLFLRHNRLAKLTFQRYWILYPALVALIVGSLTYPLGFGRFIGGEKHFSQAAKDFFENCTWSAPRNSSMACPDELVALWMGPHRREYAHYTTLICFLLTYFFLSALASTVPIPCGIFGPSFVFGAAIGRLAGELVADLYPTGIKGIHYSPVYPGVYAVVGAAAFCGGVTHTVSVAVIVFELTGQLLFILPVMIAVLAANAVSSYLQPSIYDSAIRIKRLPYLPEISHNSSQFHGVHVAQFMTREVCCIHNGITYGELRSLLAKWTQLKAFPLVENETSRILIGSCSRARLMRALHARIGMHARRREAQCRRINAARQETLRHATMPDDECTMARSVQEGRFTVRKSVTDLSALVHAASECNKAQMKRSQTIPAVLSDTERNVTITTTSSGNLQQQQTLDVYTTLGGMIRTLGRWSSRLRKSADEQPPVDDGDLHGQERMEWEQSQLARRVKFDAIGIDSAPFQLVAHTSLIKVHSLFSLLGLRRAYVTRCGQLIGVVALRDLRLAIERANSGELVAEEETEIIAAEEEIVLPEEEEAEVTNSPSSARMSRQSESSSSSTAGDNDDDDKDILNPRLKVVSRAESSVHPAANAAALRESVRLRAHVRSASEALRQIAKGMLGSAGDAECRDSICQEQGQQRHFSTDNDDHEQQVVEQQQQPKLQVPPAIFVISSDNEEGEKRMRRKNGHIDHSPITDQTSPESS